MDFLDLNARIFGLTSPRQILPCALTRRDFLGASRAIREAVAVIVYGLPIGTGFTLFLIPAIFAIFVENFGMNIKANESQASLKDS